MNDLLGDAQLKGEYVERYCVWVSEDEYSLVINEKTSDEEHGNG